MTVCGKALHKDLRKASGKESVRQDPMDKEEAVAVGGTSIG